jgi:aldose 1-epimerase
MSARLTRHLHPGDFTLIQRIPHGHTPEGHSIDAYTLSFNPAFSATVITYGGILTQLVSPDRYGHAENIVLGYSTLEDYLANPFYLGAIIGRYANRIAGHQFTLDGMTHALTANDRTNTLHGGKQGLHKVVWEAHTEQTEDTQTLRLVHHSPAGIEGFPGALTLTVTYQITRDHSLSVDYRATTDAPTVINLTQHSYFNLHGTRGASTEDHLIQIAADHYLPGTELAIPTGEYASVSGTPFDFRQPKPLGADIRADHLQIKRANGYDHSFVLKCYDPTNQTPQFACSAYDPVTGRLLTVSTTEPSVHLYSGNFLGGPRVGSAGRLFRPTDGFCFETQHFPDSPNQPAFPSTVLRPGEVYRSQTVFALGVR